MELFALLLVLVGICIAGVAFDAISTVRKPIVYPQVILAIRAQPIAARPAAPAAVAVVETSRQQWAVNDEQLQAA